MQIIASFAELSVSIRAKLKRDGGMSQGGGAAQLSGPLKSLMPEDLRFLNMDGYERLVLGNRAVT